MITQELSIMHKYFLELMVKKLLINIQDIKWQDDNILALGHQPAHGRRAWCSWRAL